MGGSFRDTLRARDVSVGGIGVRVPHEFAGCDLQDAVDLIVKLPGRRPFKARGVIRHITTQAALFGIEFTTISDEARATVVAYVEELVALGRTR